MLKGKRFKRYAELDGEYIIVHADVNSVARRKIKESDVKDWPDLFPDGVPVKKKRRRRKKVKHEDVQGAAEHSTE